MSRKLACVCGALAGALALSVAPVSAFAQGREPAPVARTPVPGAPAGVTAFVNVNVVPLDTERVLPNQTVLVQQGWITALGPASQVKVPAGAVRVDGQGKYLMPGLADMHAHLGFVDDNRTADSALMEQRLFRFLAGGVTTIRNLDYWFDDGGLSLRLRARAATGGLWSPRIYTAGLWGPLSYVRPERDAPPPPLDSVMKYVTAYKAAGYDFIKVHDEAARSPGTIDSLIVAARRVGIPILGHTDRARFEQALASYASIEHMMNYGKLLHPDSGPTRKNMAEGIYDLSKLPVAAATIARAGIWHCPTQALKGSSGNSGDNPPARRLLIKALQDAGAGLLLGTDTPIFSEPGMAAHLELQAFVKEGLTPYQALLTGTRNVAQYFGTLDGSGTVAMGKRADLVLLTGNPLEDIRHTAQNAGVMLGGRWLPRAEIDRRLAETKPTSAASP